VDQGGVKVAESVMKDGKAFQTRGMVTEKFCRDGDGTSPTQAGTRFTGAFSSQ